ncbi:hypothetical protein Vwe01_52460 [Micromonospora andamanensis]|nr:hypothetical protein Vwe01_52460 [Micromonospora andamanensis]
MAANLLSRTIRSSNASGSTRQRHGWLLCTDGACPAIAAASARAVVSGRWVAGVWWLILTTFPSLPMVPHLGTAVGAVGFIVRHRPPARTIRRSRPGGTCDPRSASTARPG